MKLLLIMPRFFDYPELIIEELNNLGYEVDFFDDRPSTNAWIKAIIRINKKFISKYIEKYFDRIMETINKTQYDVVFLISGQSLSFSEEMIKTIRNTQKNANFVLYQWDSQKNFSYIKRIQKYFDKCYSFDRMDVAETPNLKFLPLFYSNIYKEIGKKNKKDFVYDFCFVGTAHPQKYKFIKLMSTQLRNIYGRQFIYFFFPSRIVFFYRKIMNKELRHAKYKEFHFEPLNGKKLVNIYEQSKCVMDSAQEGQNGLTIRVIEALGAKKKIITTNQDIVNYDFYCPENIYIYNGEINLDSIFFQSDYKMIDEKIYNKYSLSNWLKEVINSNEDSSN